MAKSYCTHFANCATLAKRFGVDPGVLDIFVNIYNKYVPGDARIRPDISYTQEQLDEIYNKISTQRQEKKKDKKYNSDERDLIIKSLGGPEALAYREMTAVFTAEEMQELMNEVGRLVIDRLEASAKGSTIEALLEKDPHLIDDAFEYVRGIYLTKYQEAVQVAKGGVPKSGSNIQTVEDAMKVGRIVQLLFQQGRVAGKVFESLKVMSLSVINQALGVRIRGDFSLEAEGDVTYELADSIKDMEEPTQERYMQALDAQGLEDSLSSIVSRILMQLPQRKTVVTSTIKTVMVNGKEKEIVSPETRSEVVRSTVTGQPLYSDPKVVARRLTNVLAHITGEQDMMDTLRGAGYDDLCAVLDKYPERKTTFFQNFNKYLQAYRAVNLEKLPNGTISASVSTLGRSKNEGFVSYWNRLKMGNISENSMFALDENNKVVFKMLNKNNGLEAVKGWFDRTFYSKGATGDTTLEKSSFGVSSPAMKEAYLTALLEYLNVPVTQRGIGILLSDPAKLVSFIGAVNTILTKGSAMLGSNFSQINRNIKGRFFNDSDISSAIGTIMSIVEATPKSFYGSRVTYEGSSLSTSIMNSPLSILAKKINSLYNARVEGQTRTDLTNFLEAKFLGTKENPCRQFRSAEGVILNRWIKDFIACAEETELESAKSIFGFVRDLGIDHKKVEDISDQEHMLLLVQGYLKGRTYAETDDVVVSSEEEAIVKSKGNPRRYIVSGTPYYYRREKRYYRTDTSYIPSFITGDTNAVRQIKTIHYYEDEILDGIHDLFLADKFNQEVINYFNSKGMVFSANGKEAYTSRQVKVNGKKTRKSNADKFGILQFLNQKVGGTIAKEYGDVTWYEYFLAKAAEKVGLDSKALTKDQKISLEADEVTFKEVTSEYLNQGFEAFKDQLSSLGLLTKTEGRYVYFDFLLGENTEDKEALLDSRLRDFYYDYKFGQYNQAHLMQVNPLFFNGVEEHQKRNKGILTNGAVLSMEAKDREGNYLWGYNPETNTFDFTSKVVYFKDVKVAMDKDSAKVLFNYFKRLYAKTNSESKAAEMAKKHMDKFNSNSLTDGQAYRSLESYRKVLMSAGMQYWTDSHENAYNLIMSIVTPVREARKRGEIVALTTEQIQQIEDAMEVMQPIKPINDGQEIIDTEIGRINIPFQFKYAEVPIVPELLPVGSKLREMGDMMVDLGIDMMASDKCLKKGSYGEMDLQYKMVEGKYVDASGQVLPGMDANGNIIDDGSQTAAQQRANPNNSNKFVEWEKGTSVRDIFKAHYIDESNPGYTVHSIPMDNYLIQNNVPDHTDGNSILGTQPRKIGTGAIVNSESYQYTIGPSHKKVSGKDLARIYGAAHALKFADSYSRFADRVDDSSSTVSDLIYSILNNGRGNLASIGRLTLKDGINPTISFSEPSNSQDVQRNLISIFKKMVIRQLISGGSIVQASSLGYGKEALADTGLKAVIKDGVPIAMQAEMPFDFHYMDENGKMQKLRYEDYCDENGYFLDMDGKPIMEDRYDQIDEIAKINQDFPGITSMVAYRIPTEMEYSMFHLKIVKCNPKSTNNTIKLPAECTTIAGFDFDIDKLYLMRRNFKTNKKLDEYDVWAEFYSRNPDMEQLLREKWVEDGKPKDKPWHSYWWDVMEENKSLYERYPSKQDAYQAVEADMLLQQGMIDKTEIDYKMNPEDLVNLSQNELDNVLIDCMIAILSDESTVGDRYAIGGFDQASADAKLMRLLTSGAWSGEKGTFNDFVKQAENMEDVKPEYDYSEPMTSVIFKEQNQIAGTLIGIFANDNVNAFISKGLKTFTIKDPKNRILFGSLLDGVTELDGSIKDFNTDDVGLSFKHESVNGKSIKRTLAELLAASVDAVKDPVLNFLNLNTITADAAAMLARLGYTTRDIGLLLNQPVIKQMCLHMNRTGEKNTRRALIAVLEGMGVQKAADLFKSIATIDSSILTSENLAKGLNAKVPMDLRQQSTVAQLFNSIMQTKSDFSNYVQQTRNTSANTVKSRFEDYLSSSDKSNRQFERIVIETNDEIGYPITDDITEQMLSSKKGLRSLIEKYKDHPFLYENIVASIIRHGMNRMMSKYTLFNTPLYSGYRGIFAELVAPWGLSGDQIEALYRDIPVMLISSMDGDFNPEGLSEDGVTPNAIKYVDPDRKYFLEDLKQFLIANPEVNETAIIEALDSEAPSSGSGDSVRLTFKYSRSIGQLEKLALTLSWDKLMRIPSKQDEEGHRVISGEELAKGLYLHFYYTRGLNPISNVAMELAPVSVLQALRVDEGVSYADFFENDRDYYQDDVSSPDGELAAKKNLYQFLLTHNGDSNLVRTVNVKLSDHKSPDGKEVIFGKNKLDLVTLQKVKDNGKVVGVYYAPVIKIEGQLYVLAEPDGVDTFTIDFKNYKASNIDTVKYVAASELDTSIKAEEEGTVVNTLITPFLGENNSLIYKHIPESVSMVATVNSEDVVADDTPASDTTEEAYDNAKDRTKDQEVQSSDGKPKCHMH